MEFTPLVVSGNWRKWSKLVHLSRHSVNHLQAHGDPPVNQLATIRYGRDVLDYELGVNKAGRPYRLYPADPGREFRAEFLTMPPVGESKASLAAPLSRSRAAGGGEVAGRGDIGPGVCQGATTGYSRGLAKRNEVLGRLDSEGTISRKGLVRCGSAIRLPGPEHLEGGAHLEGAAHSRK